MSSLFHLLYVFVPITLQSHGNNTLRALTLYTYIQEKKGVKVKSGVVVLLDYVKHPHWYNVPHHKNKHKN